MELTKAQQMMVEDGLPAELLLTQEQRVAWWKAHPQYGVATREHKAREQVTSETAAPRSLKDTRGERWDSRAAKRAPIPTEFRMKDDTKSTPEPGDQPTTTEDTMTVTAKKTAKTAKKAPAKKVAKKAKTAAKVVKAAKKGNGAVKRTPREGNKTQEVLTLMRKAAGITRAKILEITGWKAISVQALVKSAGLNPDKDLKISDERPFTYRLTK